MKSRCDSPPSPQVQISACDHLSHLPNAKVQEFLFQRTQQLRARLYAEYLPYAPYAPAALPSPCTDESRFPESEHSPDRDPCAASSAYSARCRTWPTLPEETCIRPSPASPIWREHPPESPGYSTLPRPNVAPFIDILHSVGSERKIIRCCISYLNWRPHRFMVQTEEIGIDSGESLGYQFHHWEAAHVRQ